MSNDKARSYGVSDAPLNKLEDDKLGFKSSVESLQRFISNCQTPMTIGIQGGWGTGKTSLMKMIEGGLDPHTIKVWINTWQYAQVYDEKVLPLSIIGGLADGLAKEGTAWAEKIRGGLREASALAKLAVKAKLGLDFDTISRPDHMDGVTIVEQMHNKFKETIAAIHGKNDAARIVFFIDDLDRIAPHVAVAILEAIKNFIEVHGCVFVLAIDFDVIMRGLEGRSGVEGREFFEKIIQVPFHLRAQSSAYTGYLTSYLNAVDGSTRTYEGVDLEMLFEPTTRMNPRAIKRAFNLYSLLMEMNRTANDERSKMLLLAMTCLQVSSLYWPVYTALAKAEVPVEVLLRMSNGGKIVSYAKAAEKEQATKVWNEQYKVILKLAEKGGKAEPDLVADLGEIATFFIGILDSNADGGISQEEAEVLHGMLDISSATTETEDNKQRRNVVSFLQLQEAGLIPKGVTKLVCTEVPKKVHMVFKGTHHRVHPSIQAGAKAKGDPMYLRVYTRDLLEMQTPPSNYVDYWKLEIDGPEKNLGKLIEEYRKRAEG